MDSRVWWERPETLSTDALACPDPLAELVIRETQVALDCLD